MVGVTVVVVVVVPFSPSQRDKLTEENLKPKEQLTLEPYERDHAVVVGTYRGPKSGAGVQ